MTQRLFLVRHGPTHAKGMIGWTDLPADLSDTDALTRLSDWLPHDAHVVSSDLSRAVATADAIQGSRPRAPHDPAFREMNFGDWEAKTWKEVSEDEPDLIRQFYENPGDIAPPNGESWLDLSARVSPAVDAMLAANPTRDLILVCHYGVVLNQWNRATGQTAYETFAHKVDNLSVTEIRITKGRWTSGTINHRP